MTPREQALSNTPEARKWVAAAVNALSKVLGFSGKRSQVQSLPEFKALETHFHVSLGAAPGIVDRLLSVLPFVELDPTLVLLKDIRFRYFDIMTTLSKDSIFVDSPAEGEGKDATAFVPRVRDGTLRITPFYSSVGSKSQVLVLVHEATHFLSDVFQDHAYRDRKGEDDPQKYINLPVQFAIRNADSYAYFALQMATGIDRVLEQDE